MTLFDPNTPHLGCGRSLSALDMAIVCIRAEPVWGHDTCATSFCVCLHQLQACSSIDRLTVEKRVSKQLQTSLDARCAISHEPLQVLRPHRCLQPSWSSLLAPAALCMGFEGLDQWPSMLRLAAIQYRHSIHAAFFINTFIAHSSPGSSMSIVNAPSQDLP
jgi:hypothetical protein